MGQKTDCSVLKRGREGKEGASVCSYPFRVVTELQSEKHIIEMKYIFNGLVSIFNGKMQLKSNGATPT